MMKWILRALIKNYFNFNGRARRKEYWYYHLFQIIVNLSILCGIFILSEYLGAACLIVSILLFVLTIIPSLAVTVRRLHDRNMSGWWVVTTFIPYVNIVTTVFFLIIFCFKGTAGANNFGPDPLLEDC